MTMHRVRSLAFLAAVALTACSGGMLPSAGPTSQDGPQDGYYPITRADAVHAVCGTPLPGHARCFALMRTDLQAAPVKNGIPAGVGYTPTEIASAYHLPQERGVGQTVASVDAYGYAQAASDLAYYRKAAGLPPCTTANGCLRIVNQSGQASPLPPPNTNPNDDWRGEQALDLDAISATCPKCKILLVQTNSDYENDLAAGASTAANLNANVINNSYGVPESASGSSFAGAYNHPGHLFVASAGDNGGGTREGGGPAMPCVYTSVVCVGGTALVRDKAKARGWKETVWDTLTAHSCPGFSNCGATGSGCSTIVSRPSFQTEPGCTMRVAADVSADASVFTPIAVYSVLFRASGGGGWAGYGGTSLAAPIIAGVYALAGNAHLQVGAQWLWVHHSRLNDVTSGTNVLESETGPCASPVPLVCVAGVGYDGPSGLGTPNGVEDF